MSCPGAGIFTDHCSREPAPHRRLCERCQLVHLYGPHTKANGLTWEEEAMLDELYEIVSRMLPPWPDYVMGKFEVSAWKVTAIPGVMIGIRVSSDAQGMIFVIKKFIPLSWMRIELTCGWIIGKLGILGLIRMEWERMAEQVGLKVARGRSHAF